MAAPKGNKFALGNTGGRPPYFKTVEEMEKKITAYFNYCRQYKEKLTITGLTLYLGFCQRSALDDYAAKNNEFSHIIKRAKLAVENGYEINGQTIDIFALKNMGWTDRQEVLHDLPRGFLNIDPLNDQADPSPSEDSPSQ